MSAFRGATKKELPTSAICAKKRTIFGGKGKHVLETYKTCSVEATLSLSPGGAGGSEMREGACRCENQITVLDTGKGEPSD